MPWLEGLQYRHKGYETLSPRQPVAYSTVGSGGAARAAAHVLQSWEIWPTFVSRSLSNEDTLRYSDLDHHVIQEYLLIINASPVGQGPDVEHQPMIPYDSIGEEHLVFDMVYNPVMTSFLKAVSEQGGKTLDGMTVWGQAEALKLAKIIKDGIAQKLFMKYV